VEDSGPTNSLVNAQLIGSEFSEIPSHIIIPDAVDGTVLGTDIDDESDEIEIEEFSAGLLEFNDVDPGLSNLETGDNNSKGHKSAPFPEWFKRALAEKLAIIEKHSSSGELMGTSKSKVVSNEKDKIPST